MFVVRRSDHNPIIKPYLGHPWEAHATFNWAPIQDGVTTHVVYRAMIKPGVLSHPNFSVSSVGYARSTDNEHFKDYKQLIVPEEKWERFGCEDPRVTRLGDWYYIFYTALAAYPYTPNDIKTAVAKTKDFEKIEEKHLMTPFNSKATVLFPEKINGKFALLLSVHTDMPPSKIAYAEFENEEDMWNEKKWMEWYHHLDEHALPVQRYTDERVELGTVPIKTNHGWLVVYGTIQHASSKPVFAVNALLLDINNPKKIIGRTKTPLLVPEENYEKFGLVPNVIWPSGAIINGDLLEIYYGATDTTCCKAGVNVKDLIESMRPDTAESFVYRFEKNPILTPIGDDWEAKAVFNPAAIDLEGKIYILYRAMSSDNTSTIGMAVSSNGRNIDERLPEPVYIPRKDFELKKNPGGNSGCEDPRITKLGDRLYMAYTAYDGVGAPQVAITSISQRDFLARRWDWEETEIFSPAGVEDKDACLFPEKIRNKYMVLHRISPHVCADEVNTLDFKKEKIDRCIQLIGPRPGMWDSKKVGISGPPLKTEAGWILFYHGVSENGTYRVGVALLDKEDPTAVLGRSTDFILEPLMAYEKEGQVNKVVFPCGSVVRGDEIFLYYGGGDSVVGGASLSLKKLLDTLVPKGSY